MAGALMESFFMGLKYDGLYRSWPFLTTRLMIYNSVRPEFAERVGKIAEDYKYRSNPFTPSAQMTFMRELPDSPVKVATSVEWI
ncbi:hypothetical protein G9A89_015278 [Geosiphon pyriformis]|nr:hypothetical protein G9A89_015278 [Geosiphon pyriformis]